MARKILTGVEKDIKTLQNLGNNAKIKMALNKHLRNYGFLNQHFGIQEFAPELKDKYVDELNKTVDELVWKLIERVKERYANASKPEANEITSEDKKRDGEEKTKPTEDSSPRAGTTLDDSRGINTTPEETPQVLHKVSIFNPKFPDQKATLTTQHSHGCEQLGTAQRIWDDLHEKKMKGQYLFAMAGAGKTYINAAVIKNVIANGYLDHCFSPWPILYITKSSVVEQTKGVLRDEFGIDVNNTCQVINIEQLRSVLMDVLIKADVRIIDGEPKEFYYWLPAFKPALVIWDEAQVLARADKSTQAKIAASIHDEKSQNPLYPTYEIFSSATPGSKISEFKCFAVATEIIVSTGIGERKLDNDYWPFYAKEVASPGKPDDLNQAAVGRFIDVFEPYIKRVKNIRPRHKAFNSVERITFSTPAEQKRYEDAVENHQKRKAKIEGDDRLTEQQRNMALLAEFTIFCKEAEDIRVPVLTNRILERWDKGLAPVVGFRFKQTATHIIQKLILEHGWKRSDISVIWGGATETLSAKKKLAAKLKSKGDAFQEALSEMGIDLEEDLGIDLSSLVIKTDEQLAFEKEHGLLTQKPLDREYERLAFQAQQSRCCLFSYKSGGVGLSLHHEEKYRNARPRKVDLTPVYSEKELVQGLGRCPRLTSASNTEQVMIYYVNTIEDHVAAVVKTKLKCLREVTRGISDDWSSIITGKESKAYKRLTDAADKVNAAEEDEADDLAAQQEALGTMSEYVEKEAA